MADALDKDLNTLITAQWSELIKKQPTNKVEMDKLVAWLTDQTILSCLDFAIICALQSEVDASIVAPASLTNPLGIRVCVAEIWLQCKAMQTKGDDIASGKAVEKEDDLLPAPVRDGKLAKFQETHDLVLQGHRLPGDALLSKQIREVGCGNKKITVILLETCPVTGNATHA